MNGVLLDATKRWYCPNCPAEHVTTASADNRQGVQGWSAPYHRCRGLRGLNAPLIPAGTKAKVETREREDYVGRERVHTDGDGRPVMSVVTTRDDGMDCTVFAPCTTATRDEVHGG